VSTRLDDGWRVSIDDHRTTLRPGPFGVMSVRAPAGWRSVRFTYKAPGLRIGLALAACGLLACLVVSTRSAARRFHGARIP
jgi:uncharacterized membrane protein YfhO